MTELLTQADSEFQQGNFELAAELYSKVLDESSDESDENSSVVSADSVPVLLKLGDAEYARDSFAAARTAYARVQSFYKEFKPAAKDEISLLLKLARCYDKSADDAGANENYGAAYELSKSGLSEKHFLRRTVCDAYVDWLRKTKAYPEVLERIQQELGIEPEPAPKADEDEKAADEQDEKPTASRGEIREQEYTVMRSAIAKLKKRKIERAEATAETSVLKKGEDSKPTVDQQVAERKFLRKGQGDRDAQSRTQNRSKLRSALSQKNERREGVNPVEGLNEDETAAASGGGLGLGSGDLSGAAAVAYDGAGRGAGDSTGSSIASHDMSGAVDELAQLEGESGEGDGPTGLGGARIGRKSRGRGGAGSRDGEPSAPYMPPMSTSVDDISYDPASLDKVPVGGALERENAELVRTNMAAKKGLTRRLDERAKKGVNLSAVPASGSTISETGKVFLKQADAIKKASGETAEAVDVEQLREEKKISLPASRKMKQSLNVVPAFIGLVVLSAICVVIVSSYMSNAGKKAAVPAFVHDASNRSFVSSDGTLSVSIEPEVSTVTSSALGQHKVGTFFFTGSIGDEFKLLLGGYKNAKFLTVTPQGLVSKDKVTLYAYDAPERLVLAYINKVAEDSQALYFKTGSYPAYANEITNQTYQNPFDKRMEPVEIISTVDNKADDVRETELDKSYKAGEPFKKEPDLHPGAVHAISIISHYHASPDGNSATWGTHCFYIRGADRNGKLIPGSTAGSVYMITLKNGRPDIDKGAAVAKEFDAQNICLCPGEPPQADAIALKYLIPLALLVLVIVVLFRNRIMLSMSRGLDSARSK